MLRRLLAATLAAGLLMGLVSSPVGAATDENRRYIRAIYFDVLDRTSGVGDESGVDYWADLIESGRTRTNVARSIQFASDEYFASRVRIAYELLLERSADATGLDFYVDGWRARRFTWESIVASIAGSDEYYARSERTVEGFVDKAFFDILGREPDAGGRAYYIELARTRSRTTVAGELVSSVEYRRGYVAFQFNNLLGRNADAAGLRFWTGQLEGGLRHEELVVRFVGSAEYYNNNS